MINKTEQKVLKYLLNAINRNEYKYCDYTNKQIANKLKLSISTISSIVSKLAKLKILQKSGYGKSRILHIKNATEIEQKQINNLLTINHKSTINQPTTNQLIHTADPENTGTLDPLFNTNIKSNTNININNNICQNDIFLGDKAQKSKSQTEQDFEILYKLYQTVPPPQGRTSRKKSLETYHKLHKSGKLPNFEILEAKIEQYNLSLDPNQGGKYKKGLQYWLSAEAWDDDYIPWRESQTIQRLSREPMNEAIEADGDYCIFF